MNTRVQRNFPKKRLARACVAGAICLMLLLCERTLACSFDYFPSHEFVMYFSLSDSELSPLAVQFLENHVYDEYRSNDVAAVLVCGHSDQASGFEENLDLSKRRAEAVAERLIALGIDAEIVQICWRGESELAVDGGENTSDPNNRRVEILLYF